MLKASDAVDFKKLLANVDKIEIVQLLCHGKRVNGRADRSM